MEKFQLVSEYQPTGDEPAAPSIKLVEGLRSGMHEQTLLGVNWLGQRPLQWRTSLPK